MVLFYTSTEGYIIYMGKDKFENEDLIKYGLPEDMWFHVDDMSSAHVYLRLRKNQRLEDVSEDAIMECAQLVKANSIEGCKKADVRVIYTRWRNLKKTHDMEVGAIGFHDKSKIKGLRVERDRDAVKKIEKTKTISFPNLELLQEERAREFREEKKAARRGELQLEKEVAKEREVQKRQQSYADFLIPANMHSAADLGVEATVDDSAARDFEDDFM
jgi:hypothetical protein